MMITVLPALEDRDSPTACRHHILHWHVNDDLSNYTPGLFFKSSVPICMIMLEAVTAKISRLVSYKREFNLADTVNTCIL
ncbi:unnamed protein product [Dicrocoelium dendriticum]|nr:unnamed protein product [Dicrocoelium dendriticum]